MIASFRHKALRRLFESDDRSRLPAAHVQKISLVLLLLDEADEIEELNRPGFRLHGLKGDLAGFWSISINANWRIIFRFRDGDAIDVDYVDYH